MKFPIPLTLALCLLASQMTGAAPAISSISPPPGGQLGTLASVQITFSESVGGVDASDLFVNGALTQDVSGTGAGPYTFTFTQPLAGVVSIEFAGDHGIAGTSGSGSFVPPASWSYTLVDTLAPASPGQFPVAGATVGSLTEAQVTFSEPVTGVSANDFKINGVAAATVTGFGSGPYTFAFPQPAAGAVNFTWGVGHGIVDLAGNAFAGAGWSVTRSAAGAGNLVINEFTAINPGGYLDGDGDNEAWIEIHNPGPGSVNLGGWALSDESDAPRKWIFPSRTLAAGNYLVVFASEKDRRPVSGELHTNFKLGPNGGTLLLVRPDQPVTYASSFADYPGQRAGYSYGMSGGIGRYFTPTTPGTTNSSATVLSAMAAPPVSGTPRGFFSASFPLTLSTTTSGATIRYTKDGSEPTASTGTLYGGPVTVSATTVIRAAAFANGFVPSATVTNTYIFQDQVISQSNTPAGFPTNWGTNSAFPGGIVPADYAMDSDPLRVTPTNSSSALDPAKVQRFNDGLRELPSLSIATPPGSLFTSTGMYHSNNVTNKNFPDKACSVEMILPDGATAFATTSGLRIHGNASREPQKNPKHGFKLKFKPEFGPGKLEYKLFPESAVEEYDDIVVRAEFGTSWRHWSDTSDNAFGAMQRSRSTGIRDQWMKDTMLEMGGVASHSRLAHVFLNGLYFGVYDLTEDPSSAFGENFLGGQKNDYDVYDQGVLAEGTSTIYSAMTSLPAATANSTYEQFKGYLDMPSFIDYMLLHFYVGHQDWGLNKNWSAIRQRAGGTFTTEGKFRYIPWDLECILLNTSVNRVPNAGGSSDVPSGLHTKLDDNAQYRLDFADRVHRNMIAPGGAMTQARNTTRWQKWQAILDKPIVAESCRWGDYRRDVHPYQEGSYALYTRESHWLAENTRITGTYFPNRPATVMNQLRTAGLYPTLNAPEIRNSGVAVGTSQVTAGYQITLALPVADGGTTSAGTIYYTTDGTDPRIIYSNAVSPTATAYIGTPLTISATTTVKSRALNGATWSALNEATFSTDSSLPPVRITELMYNPPTGDPYEFLELFNVGTREVDLNGWYFNGVTYVFPPGSKIGPGSHMVIACNDTPAGWRTKYSGVSPTAYYAGNLSNGGETISLLNAAGVVVCSVTYDDSVPWPVTPDGDGYSLEVIDPLGDPNDPSNWKASTALDGSPGTPNSAPPAPEITGHPQDQTIAQDDEVSFTASATGSGLSYQWKFGETEIPGATSATYNIPAALPDFDGVYRCVVTNTGGSVTSDPAKLIVTQDYAQWIADTSLTGLDADIDADPDNDGLPNIFEFYHHLDPSSADFAASSSAAFHFESPLLPEDSSIKFSYRTNLRARLGDTAFEKNSALATPWQTVSPSLLETISTDPLTRDPRMRATFPIEPGDINAFYRLRLSP